MSHQQDHRDQIHELAREALKDHELAVVLDTPQAKIWRCAEPGTNMYAFYAVALPGVWLVYGDVGNQWLRIYEPDVVGWLKGAVISPSYFLEKVQNKHTSFQPHAVPGLIAELWADTPDLVQEFQARWARTDETPDNFADLLYELGGDVDELSAAYDVSSDVLWFLECSRKFVELHLKHTTTT